MTSGFSNKKMLNRSKNLIQSESNSKGVIEEKTSLSVFWCILIFEEKLVGFDSEAVALTEFLLPRFVYETECV